MSTKRKIAQATLIIVFFSLLGKMLGFAREIIIAAIFGTTYRTDAYFIGLTGPDFIREIISGGVLTAVFIPVYTASLSESKDKAEKFLNSISTMLIGALGIAVLFGIPLSSYLVRVVAPELDATTSSLAVQITEIIFPSILFMGIASLYGSLLNVHKHFLSPALTQLMLNIGIIAGVVILGRKYGVQSLAVGFLLGAVLQFVVLFPALRSNAVGFRIAFDWKSDEMRKIYSLWLPLFVATFVGTANDLVSRSLAAGLAQGNIAALNFANRIRETVWLLCGVPLGTAIFPYLSSHAANNEHRELENILSFAIRLTTFIALPICLIMLFYSKPIIRLLFERGLFDASSTLITSKALVYYSLGALFYALNYVVLRVYYSMHDTGKPLKIFILAFVINIVAGLILRKYLFVGGITLARSLSDMATFVLLLAGIGSMLKEIKVSRLYLNMLKTGSLAFVSVAISYFVYIQLPVSNEIVRQSTCLLIAWCIAIFCYAGLGILFRVGEVLSFWNIIRKRIAI